MKSILLVGSSIFQEWTQATSLLSNCRIVNQAVGGTQTADWIYRLTEIIPAESPDAVLYYCGSNDLNVDLPLERIMANVMECRLIIRRESPSTRFAYFGIIKAPQKVGRWEVIDELNEKIARALPAGDLYVDTNTLFFQRGEPVKEWFIEDGLHLTKEGYGQLSSFAARRIDKWLNE